MDALKVYLCATKTDHKDVTNRIAIAQDGRECG